MARRSALPSPWGVRSAALTVAVSGLVSALGLGWWWLDAAPSRPAGTLVGIVGSGPEARVVELPSGRPLAAAPSYPYGRGPEGTLLLTVDNDVALLDSKGSLRRLAASAANDWHPALQPGGHRVLFESNRDAFRELYLLDLDAKQPRRLTHDPEGNFDGSWSSDGRRICFSSSRAQQLDLYVMNADGTAQTRWTRHPGDAVRCAFSSDGNHVAYLSARDGRDDVFVIDGAGELSRNVTGEVFDRPAQALRFAWHPEAARLLVSAGGFGTPGRVFVLDLDSGERLLLTPDGASDAEADWSPDGEWVALVRRVDGEVRLVTIHVATGHTERLGDGVEAWLLRWLPPTGARKGT